MSTHNTDIGQLVKEKREEILRIAAQHGAYNVRIFGSVARGEAGPESDVDFLVEMESGRSLLDLAGLLVDLQDLLGCKVDVATKDALHWYIRDRILKEAVTL
jgi:predicted nucleotidyltransferase